MDITDLINPETLIPDLKVTSKKQTLQELANFAEATINRPSHEIFDILVERERLGTTGVGHGVAIPHGKFPGLDRLHGVFARLQTPVNFESLDDRPVDLVFMLLAPEDAGADHLKALAKVSRLLRNKQTCEKLRGSETAEALFAILTASDTSSNAA